jgi:large subunit ribosomal protein L22
MEVRAIARNVGVAPRKVRLVTGAVKGRKVSEALALLSFMPHASAKPVHTLIKSAVANAERYALDPEDLYIVQIVADAAPTIKRMRITSRRGAQHVMKRRSHITVVVSDEFDVIPKAYRKNRPR